MSIYEFIYSFFLRCERLQVHSGHLLLVHDVFLQGKGLLSFLGIAFNERLNFCVDKFYICLRFLMLHECCQFSVLGGHSHSLVVCNLFGHNRCVTIAIAVANKIL